ncbi:OprD family porin [Stutzerimonas chloritidismutans]|uniref:OprD family porin n=1 Tax=Stutzerimonas chloritidismutans TaxID=203192 RepID=UPI00384BD9BA
MKVMKWSVIAMAVAAGTSQMALASSQSESEGFVEGSSLTILNRNLYMNRDFRDDGNDGQSYREEWGHGFIGTFESGFTQGTIGVGVDAIGLLGVKLDTGRGRNGNGLFPVGSDGRAADDYSEAGGAIKLRASNTVLKYGTQLVALPILSTDDARLLPETAEGTIISSSEIEGLELNGGYFTALNAMASTDHDSSNGGALESIAFAGGTYAISDALSASLYYSDVKVIETEDDFEKFYGNLNYNMELGADQSLAFDFNIYKTDVDAADSDNIIWSLASTYSFGAHGLTVAYQQNSGDDGYRYGLDGGGTIWVANSVQYSDFQGEDEKSWQARYDLNMASYGVPGLSFMTRYVNGYDISTATGEGKEREWDMEAKYVVQDGAAKDLSLRIRHAKYWSNSDYSDYGPDLTDLRLIVEYPLSIL